jgi:hypothetical protein
MAQGALVQTPILSAMWNDIVQRIQMAATLQIRIEARFAPEPFREGRVTAELLGSGACARVAKIECEPRCGATGNRVGSAAVAADDA